MRLQMLYALAQQFYFQMQGMFVLDIAAALAYDGAIWGNIAQHHGARANFAARANVDRSKDGGASTNYYIIAYGGMAFANIFAGAAQGHALVNYYIITYFAGFPNNHACTVVYEYAVANFGSWVYFYSGQKP